MSSMKKALPKQGLSQPALILSLETTTPTISKKSFSTSQKPFMRWWEDTLDNHWPYPVPADLSPEKQRIWKMAEICHAIRFAEGKDEK